MAPPDMIEIPLDRAQAFGRLLMAARVWRADLIPGTSSSTWRVCLGLLTALSTFDEQPCPHDRQWRVYHFIDGETREECAHCGSVVEPDP